MDAIDLWLTQKPARVSHFKLSVYDEFAILHLYYTGAHYQERWTKPNESLSAFLRRVWEHETAASIDRSR